MDGEGGVRYAGTTWRNAAWERHCVKITRLVKILEYARVVPVSVQSVASLEHFIN
jgi:hypothetical protein